MFNWLYQIGEGMQMYSRDMFKHLCGMDVTCSAFIGTPYATYLAIGLGAITLGVLALHYYVLDSPSFNRYYHWWLMALIMAILNFAVAYGILHASIHPGGYCKDLHITNSGAIGVALFNVLTGLIVSIVLTWIPPLRRLSTNNTYTTFIPLN